MSADANMVAALQALEKLPGTSVPLQPREQAPVAIDSKETKSPENVSNESNEAPKPPESSRFAAIAKREREIQRREAEIKAREAEIQAKGTPTSIDDIRRQFSSNPLKALEALGFSYDDLTNQVLNDKEPTPELESKSVRQEFEEFKRQLAEKEEKARQDQETNLKKQHEQALADFTGEVNQFILTNSEKYELIAYNEATPLVLAVIEQHFQQTKEKDPTQPRILSIAEASDLVESYLESQTDRLLATKKISAKIGSKTTAEAPKAKSAEPQFSQPSAKTLTNSLTSSAVPSSLPANTERDRMARAMAALEKK